MVKVRDIAAYLETLAPLSLQLDFDNAGLLVGIYDRPVGRALLALDITDEVIDEAISQGAEMIVSHHPLFFRPLSRVTDDDATGRKLIKLIGSGISAMCMHTNLDAAEGGVNDALAAALGAEVTGLLNEQGITRTARLPEAMPLSDFIRHTAAALSNNGIRYHDAGREVRKLAICGGAGGDGVGEAQAAGCDTLVTADIKHHQFLEARELGINLIDADHFCTENVIIPVLAEKLAVKFAGELEVLISKSHKQPASFYTP